MDQGAGFGRSSGVGTTGKRIQHGGVSNREKVRARGWVGCRRGANVQGGGKKGGKGGGGILMHASKRGALKRTSSEEGCLDQFFGGAFGGGVMRTIWFTEVGGVSTKKKEREKSTFLGTERLSGEESGGSKPSRPMEKESFL